MRALLSKQPGPAGTLVVEEIAAPKPGAGEVLVDVKAAGLNFFDKLIIEDLYQIRPERPFSPGAEMAGIVRETGSGVVNFKPGDRVAGYLAYGCVREQVVAEPDQLCAMPEGLDFVPAAGLAVTYGTGLHALRDRAGLQPGETLAVLGASGGVGQAAVELGKVLGARVIACASSEEKLEFCKSCGADEVVNYSSQDLKDALKTLTGGKGVDVIYDPVGGDLTEQAFRACAWGGRHLVIGFTAGKIPKLPLNLPLLKGCDVVGVFWGAFVERDRANFNRQFRELMDWCLDGRLRPHIDKTYGLDVAPAALERFAAREIKGKLIIAF
jgi:NADPH2:quinone reductase